MQDKRKNDAQDRRSEETGPTAEKLRTKDEPPTTRTQENENNTRNNGETTQEQHEPGELEQLLERFMDEAEAQKKNKKRTRKIETTAIRQNQQTS